MKSFELVALQPQESNNYWCGKNGADLVSMGWSFQYPLEQARYCKKPSGFLISTRNVLVTRCSLFHLHSSLSFTSTDSKIKPNKHSPDLATSLLDSAHWFSLFRALAAVRIWNSPREYQTHSMKVLAGGRCVNNISQFAAVATFPIPAGVQNLVRTTPYFIPRHRGLKQLRRITHPNANSPTRMQISVDRNITKLPVWHIRERIISFALRCS